MAVRLASCFLSVCTSIRFARLLLMSADKGNICLVINIRLLMSILYIIIYIRELSLPQTEERL